MVAHDMPVTAQAPSRRWAPATGIALSAPCLTAGLIALSHALDTPAMRAGALLGSSLGLVALMVLTVLVEPARRLPPMPERLLRVGLFLGSLAASGLYFGWITAAWATQAGLFLAVVAGLFALLTLMIRFGPMPVLGGLMMVAGLAAMYGLGGSVVHSFDEAARCLISEAMTGMVIAAGGMLFANTLRV